MADPGLVSAVTQPASQAQEQLKLPFSLSRNPERENLPAELLTDYELVGEELLGEGAFAIVRLMRHRQSGELFALKCMEKQPLRIRNMIEQMQREVRIQQNLSHPNILRLVRVYDDRLYLYMLLEYCPKGNICTIMHDLPSQRLDEPIAAFYFEQIVTGVAWMHRNSCVHRDLKLDNMLLTEQNVVKICDFGWSAEIISENMLKTTCGTTAFWAPEIWECEQQDEAVDLWALGCLLYEMLAGHGPFHEPDQVKLKQKVLAVEFGYPPWFSNEACHAVHILLQRDPAQRVKCVDLLQHPWLKKYKEQPQQPVMESTQTAQAVADPQSSRSTVVQQTESSCTQPKASSRPTSELKIVPANPDASSPAPRVVRRSEPMQAKTQATVLGQSVSPWAGGGRRLEVPRVAAGGPAPDRGPSIESLAPTASLASARPIRPASVPPKAAQPPDSRTRMGGAAHRFASPARKVPLPVTRSISPMHYPDRIQGTSPTRRLDSIQQASGFGANLQQASVFGTNLQQPSGFGTSAQQPSPFGLDRQGQHQTFGMQAPDIYSGAAPAPDVMRSPWTAGMSSQAYSSAAGAPMTQAYGGAAASPMAGRGPPTVSYGFGAFGIPASPGDYVQTASGSSVQTFGAPCPGPMQRGLSLDGVAPGPGPMQRGLSLDGVVPGPGPMDRGLSMDGVADPRERSAIWGGAQVNSMVSRQLPSAAVPQSYANGVPQQSYANGVPQWHANSSPAVARQRACSPGAARQQLPTRLPLPQPLAMAPQSPAPAVQARSAATSTTTGSSAGQTYGLPHSSSGRLAPLSSFAMVASQQHQQQLGYGTSVTSSALNASPRGMFYG